MSLSSGEHTNQRMVDRLIAESALWSPNLIAAFRATPRHRFLTRVFVYQHNREGWREISTSQPDGDELEMLYSDRALITRLATVADERRVPISSSSQPSLMAEMLEDLRPERGQRILEIGTGTGYNAALLAHVAGPGLVHSVDVDRVVLSDAAEHLQNYSERRVQLHHGDGRDGWQNAAKFERLMVTAATTDLEPAWLAQVKDGGVLVAPIVLAPGLSFVIRGEVNEAVFRGSLTRGAHFMPLRSEAEAPLDEPEETEVPAQLKTRPAPWAGWFERQRPRLAWSSFLQALVFYGWVRGLNALHHSSTGIYSTHGVSDGDAVCWFGSEDWQVDGSAGQELGDALWKAWLRAGGPLPTEYCLTASASAGLKADEPESYHRQGPSCKQLWTLNRDRYRPGWR